MVRLHRRARYGLRVAPPTRAPAIEPLENRTLLAASLPLASGGSVSVIGSAITTASASPVTSMPVTIHAVVGASFSGDVGMISGLSPSTLSLLKATVNWGDSTPATSGQLSFDTAGVLHVQGQHTYAGVGACPVTVSVIQSPPPGSLQPSRLYVINSNADVTRNSAGGVTIRPVIGQLFAGVVGTFSFPQASAVNYVFTGTINWGDGTTSNGRIIATSAGQYNVRGNHTYTAAGRYRISIVVTARLPAATGPTPVMTPTFVMMVADILSTAVVSPLAPTV